MQVETALIHPTAIIEDGADIGPNVSVGPYSVIGSKVTLGEGTAVGPHVVIEGNTTIGIRNKIFQFASIGAIPQDLKYQGEDSRLEIGNDNIIREYVTLQPGTDGGGMITKIGDTNLFMANSHVGHDTIIGSKNIIANSVGLSGHVLLGNGITIGGLCGIHQFVRLGDLAFLAGGAMVTQDIPPFCTVQGDRAVLVGLNQIGLQRAGFTEDDIKVLRKVYRTLFNEPGLMKDKLKKVEAEFGSNKGVSTLTSFVKDSERGICRARSKDITED